jgi:hypothetical protein
MERQENIGEIERYVDGESREAWRENIIIAPEEKKGCDSCR